VSARFLDEFARELSKIGARAFRRRYGVPVLIVSGRAAPVGGRRKPAALLDTARERPDGVRALMSRVFPLIKLTGGAGAIVVGRSQGTGVDVAIADPSISKRHCQFVPDDGAVNVTDCASTNGTAVNGAPVRGDATVRLCGGEIITLGRLELTYETPAGFAELVGGLEGAGA
jgi:hypothetical protein